MDAILLNQVKDSLRVLSRITEAYQANGLDECRPEWGRGIVEDLKTELYTGRGGKRLITLADCSNAHVLLMALNDSEPVILGHERKSFQILAGALKWIERTSTDAKARLDADLALTKAGVTERLT